jgi:hypothetical protein
MRSDAAPAVQLGSASQAGLLQCDGTSTTCTAGVISSVAGGGASAGASSPQGRLTLVTATPVLISDQTAKSTVYYDCFNGKSVPYYNGTSDQVDPIGGCEVSMTMATSSTGVTNSGGVFDVFWVHAGANRICVVTNGSGGGWASDTAGSNTGRGTGYSAVHNTRGYWTNTNSLTHCYNGATDYGSVSADQATYLGTLYTTAAGQTGMAFTPAAAAGGTNNFLGLYNAYNRVRVSAISRDSTSSWTYASTTWRAADGSNSNRISYVDGLAQSTVIAAWNVANANGPGNAGVDCNSTTAAPGFAVQSGSTLAGGEALTDRCSPAYGLNYVQAMEASASGTQTFFGAQGAAPTRQLNELLVELEQ